MSLKDLGEAMMLSKIAQENQAETTPLSKDTNGWEVNDYTYQAADVRLMGFPGDETAQASAMSTVHLDEQYKNTAPPIILLLEQNEDGSLVVPESQAIPSLDTQDLTMPMSQTERVYVDRDTERRS